MVQVFIMPRLVRPNDSVLTGADFSVCGNCPLRPIAGSTSNNRKGVCYVNTFQAPLAVYKAWQRGNYPRVRSLERISEIHRDEAVRLGAWGDPAAVPYEVIRAIVRHARLSTGYTHQWRTCDQRFKRLLMASVETLAEAQLAQSMNWRTFRLQLPTEPLAKNEIVCPASPEAGSRTQCHRCTLCNGSRRYWRRGWHADPRRQITIAPHGTGGLLLGKRLLPVVST
jgi:hypothetical protein